MTLARVLIVIQQVHLPFELVGGLADFAQALAQLAGEFGDFVRTEKNQDKDKDYGELWCSGHRDKVNALEAR